MKWKVDFKELIPFLGKTIYKPENVLVELCANSYDADAALVEITTGGESEQILIQDIEALHGGRYTVDEEVNRNIENYLMNSFIYGIGFRANIVVRTKDDRILYPIHSIMRNDQGLKQGGFSAVPEDSLNYIEVASNNYSILNDGLFISLDLDIENNSWLSNSIIIFYIFVTKCFFSFFK